MYRQLIQRGLLAGLMVGFALWAMSSGPAFAGGEEGFKAIFDGKSLEGWDGDPKHWRVEDGLITGETSKENPAKGNTFLIWRQGEVDDFELLFDYRFQSEWGNSGVQYRSFQDREKWGPWAVGGYQADFDSSMGYAGILYGERYRGILAMRGQKTVIGPDHKPKVVEKFGDSKELQQYVKKNDWNHYRVTAKGWTFIHEVNGHKTIEVTDEDLAMRRRSGILALQLHAGPPMKVQFRNIRLKRLKLEGAKKVVFIAGRPSHGYLAHAHRPGCILLAKDLVENVPNVVAAVYAIPAKDPDNWPKDPTMLDNADAVVIFSDGGGGHPFMRHLDELDKLMRRGVGLACLHYAVEIPKGPPGDTLLRWIGGYYETFWSVNPHWKAEFKSFPQHPVTRGLKPFEIDDEWYYHMRFPEDMKGVTPVLTAIPPDRTRLGRDDAHGGNPTVRARKGMPEHVGWVCERSDGGRGFGFTGGHWHYNWASDNFRKVVLNAIVWIAGLDVPPCGVPSKTPTMAELKADQDYPVPENYNFDRVQKTLDGWKAPAEKPAEKK